VSPGRAEGGAIVVHGPPDRPHFSLTFDDGPGGGTQWTLELLERAGAKATFFLVGSEVERHPDMARAVRDGRHELGSHSMHHLDHAESERADALADMVEGANAIQRVLGMEPRLYRAPYGHFVPVTLAEAEKRGWGCVFWSASGDDWREGETAASIAERVLEDLRPGAIVLLHDSRRAKPTNCAPMLGALETVLEEAARRGLVSVSVGELLGTGG
jgi:peptidoglycan/xylan/chitin deacetylase (PgdA/CDA1 family)